MSPVVDWSLSRRVTVLSTAVALLLGTIALSAAVTAASSRSQVSRIIDHIGPARSNSERLIAAVVSQQSGLNGYALSGRNDDLEPYARGVQDEQQIGAATGRMLADEPPLLARLRAVQQHTSQWRSEVAAPLIAAIAASGPGGAAPVPTQIAKERFEALLAELNAFQQAMTQARDDIRTAAHRTGDLLLWLLGSAAAVVVLAGFALAALLGRLVTRPVIRLGAEVRRVAGGAYDHQIDSAGPPEVVSLARDVDIMRQRIGDELAGVSRARRDAEVANRDLAQANTDLEEANQRLEWVNRQLHAQAEELTRSNRDLEQFAYVASHDLQEPLRKVTSFCQLLQRRYSDQLDERADQYITFAVDGAQRMQRLINDLLAFSRIGRMTAGFSTVDLGQVIADLARQLDGRLDESGTELTWDRLPAVRAEEALMATLLTNLVSNSVKFRRPDVPPRVHIGCRRVGDSWEFSCTDNGIGIEPEYAEKVFVIFQRLHAKDTYPGTGIGLSIAKKIVEYHGGQIWVDPGEREGTVIRFTLPVREEELNEMPDEPAGTGQSTAAGPVATPAAVGAVASATVEAAAPTSPVVERGTIPEETAS
jgi:signal transduction histidine kinase